MTDSLRAILPPVYAKLLAEDFDRPAVVETRATCANCEMCDKGTMPAEVNAIYFRPDTKCCTFHPALTNFIVGAILRDESPDMAEGKRRIRERIANRIGVTPYGIGPSNKYTLLYRASKGSTFGRSVALKCPYLTDEGRCSVWRHRDAVCTTFFCKHSTGEKGFGFWRAFKEYIGLMEATLAVWSSKAIARDVKQPKWDEATLTLEELEDKPPKEAVYAETWGAWLGREEEFYIACYNKVRNLSREAFAKLVDETPKGREILEKVRERYAAVMNPRLPERAALNKKLRRLPVANGVVVTAPHNPYDSMLMEKELFDVLEKLTDDVPLAETRKRLLEEEGIELADELLVHLVNHAILAPPHEPKTDDSGKA